MNSVRVNHPNLSLKVPSRLLYKHSSAVGLSIPMHAIDNVAFTESHGMFRHAIERATQNPGVFVVAAWAFVNGASIDPVGFLCFDGVDYAFTPLNLAGEDFDAGKAGLNAFDIARQITDDYQADASLLRAKRGMYIVTKGKYEPLGDALYERASQVLDVALFKRMASLETLYEMASNDIMPIRDSQVYQACLNNAVRLFVESVASASATMDGVRFSQSTFVPDGSEATACRIADKSAEQISFLIHETAAHFGQVGSPNYQLCIKQLCSDLKESIAANPAVIRETSIFKDCLEEAIGAIDEAAKKSGAATSDFLIDECMCDFGAIDTSKVSDIIDAAAGNFGSHDSVCYKLFVDLLCDALNKHFSRRQH